MSITKCSEKGLKISFLALFIVLNLNFLSTYGQEQEYSAEDYKSCKSISLSGGLLGIGLGGEIRADIPFNNFIVTGSFGYKGSGVQDSNYTYLSHIYKRIVYSDCQGPIMKFGLGFKLKRWETTSNEFVADYLISIDNRTFDNVFTYSGHYQDLPVLITRYLMLEISSQPTGSFIQALTPTIDKKNVFVPDNNSYFTMILRRQKQYKYIRRVSTFDLGLTAEQHFNQTGLYLNYFLLQNHLNFSLTIGVVRRFDKPDIFEDPFNGDGMYKWLFPFQASFGYSFYIPKFISDKSRPENGRLQ